MKSKLSEINCKIKLSALLFVSKTNCYISIILVFVNDICSSEKNQGEKIYLLKKIGTINIYLRYALSVSRCMSYLFSAFMIFSCIYHNSYTKVILKIGPPPCQVKSFAYPDEEPIYP